MSTDQEWEDAKRELSKLKGETVYTLDRPSPNRIVDVDKSLGICVQATAKASWVSWEEIQDKYSRLRKEGKIRRSPDAKRSRGAFCRAILTTLTTVELAQRHPATLRYRQDGLPVRLRPREEWLCLKSSQS